MLPTESRVAGFGQARDTLVRRSNFNPWRNAAYLETHWLSSKVTCGQRYPNADARLTIRADSGSHNANANMHALASGFCNAATWARHQVGWRAINETKHVLRLEAYLKTELSVRAAY